jgi:FixJ family two-component response regulator
MTTAVTVFLVDDDAGVLGALSRLLRAHGYQTQAFASAKAFLASHDGSIPGCALLDVSMPDLDGLELQEALTAEGSQRPVIFLTGQGDIPTSVRAMRAGAIDFLTKPVTDADLMTAIARAIQVDSESRQLNSALESINARFARLTPREHEVMTHVIGGRLNKQIAGDLGTVEKTVKVHRGRVMEKMGVRSVADLVRLAERAGIAPRKP